MILNTIKNWFSLYRPYEKAILDSLVINCPECTKSILLKQLDCINKVQRHADGREVNLYCMKHGRVHFDNSLRFPNDSSELLFAIANINSTIQKQSIQTEIWLANGRIFSLIFDRSPKNLPADFVVNNIKFLANPMRSIFENEEKSLNRTDFFNQLIKNLPQEYLSMMDNPNLSLDNDWKLYNIQEIRKIAMPDKNYYVIAEKSGHGVIAIPEDNRLKQLFYLDYENELTYLLEVPLKDFMANQ
jgi:hypothetical protein